MLIFLFSASYKYLLKPVFFLFDPEKVHNLATGFGEQIGKIKFITSILSFFFGKKSPAIKQKIAGINFDGPIGLAAGFDYEAKITNILPPVGFGFHSVGTITNLEYKGNPRPRLGRLPQSKSLMVNKGFKNKGAIWTAEKLSNLNFKIPLGISIGKTNIKDCDTQKKAILDIIQAFKIFEEKGVKNSYYELNISCPNLFGNVSFYPTKNLEELLSEVDKLKLKKPVFIKMPISESNQSVKKMLDVIMKHNIKGLIFGNLQKDRKNPAIIKEEIKWQKGNFSGIPTQKRSDELISLAYKHYGNKLTIIGCGGVFTTEDAYRKIKLGASLVQLITGLIYEGPLLVAKINKELPALLKKDGFKNISEAIGAES
jgi:dihydroorotate dehydrogenase